MTLLLFFLSGFTALLYEVVWERLLHIVFGLSTYAVTVVTASFMLGLALGYIAGQSRRLSRYHPFVVYGLAEGLIGVFALVFPFLLNILDVVYVASGGSFALQIILAVLALSLPATLMGLTLPTLARQVAQDKHNEPNGLTGRKVGLLYAINTTGSVLGAFFAGVFFIRTYGVFHTTLIATAINAMICLVALTQPRRPVKQSEHSADQSAEQLAGQPEHTSQTSSSPLPVRLLFFPFLTGFIGLALQIIWVRTLICVVSNNTYSFSVVLTAILTGLALGAWLYAACGPSRASQPTKALVFLLVQALGAIAILVSLGLFNQLHAVTLDLSRQVGGNHWLALGLVRLAAAAVVTLIPATVSGFVVPLLVDFFRAQTNRSPHSSAGLIFAANTFGSLSGALTGGLVLIPLLGLSGGMVLLALVSVCAGLLLLLMTRPYSSIRLACGVIATVATLVVAVLVPKELTLMKWYDRFQNIEGELLFYREGVSGTLAVFQVGEIKELLINCIEEVPTHRDAVSTFKLLGHLPLLLQSDPKLVLVNAVGGGVTLGAAAKHDVTVEAVDIVPDVRAAMPFFGAENGNVVERTNWKLIADDGRNYLKVSPHSYDAITADATHPAAAESWMLYTLEYYQQVYDKLNNTGVYVQWLPLHNMAPTDYLSVLRTFRSVFHAETLLLFTSRYTLLVGAKQPLSLSPDVLDQRLSQVNAEVRADLEEIGISRGQDILKHIIFDGPRIDALVRDDYPLLTDDHTSVEFAELNRLGIAGTMPFILARLLPHIHPDRLAEQYGVEPEIMLARALFMRSKAVGTDDPLERSYAALSEVYQASRLTPEDKDIDYYRKIATLEFLDLLSARYAELLSSSSPRTLLPKASLAAQLRPDNPFVQELLGVTLLKLEQYEDALGPLEAAVKLRQGDFNYLSNLAFAYDQVGRYEDALGILRQAKGINPNAAQVLDQARARIEQKMRDARQ